MASPIVESWIYSTMLIENEWGKKGTGFMVRRALDDKKSKIFLATNKHVIHRESTMRKRATTVVLYLNIKNSDGSITGQRAKLLLNLNDGSKIWREHTDGDVDVLVFDVTSLFIQNPQVTGRWADYSVFADRKKLEELDVAMGDEVIVIGYPLGLRHKTTNLPLVRDGIIATLIGDEIEDDYLETNGTIRKRTLRGFLIDGATIPGSSGSPVILKPTVGRFVKDKMMLGSPPAILLGIVAETRYAPIQTSEGPIPSYAGLGFAFDAETVRETIELFFQ